MDAISAADLTGLFDAWRKTFAEQRDFLVALDGKVGDSDLGITMAKGFSAAYDAVAAVEPGTAIDTTLRAAGMAMAKAAPSTMGTLTATGLLRGSKALESAGAIGTSEAAAFFRAFANGVADRGKAKLGDKTLLDVLEPVATTLEAAAAKGEPLAAALSAARDTAAEALERTKSMMAQHGKAAAFQGKSIGLQDAGATVGLLFVSTLSEFCGRSTP